MTPPERLRPRADREVTRSSGARRADREVAPFGTAEEEADTSTKPRAPGPASDWTFAQRALVVIGWAVFLWAWVAVMRDTTPQTVVITAILLAAGPATAETIDLLWIRHNLNIYRKRGARRNVPQVRHEYSRDFLGRKLIADWSSLPGEGLIVVDFD